MLWKRVLVARYGDLEECRGSRVARGSWWWKNICSLDGVGSGVHNNWLHKNIRRKVEEEQSVKFWTALWVGDKKLCERFPRLFSIVENRNSVISELGVWEDGVWRWRWNWRRCLFQWELPLVAIWKMFWRGL